MTTVDLAKKKRGRPKGKQNEDIPLYDLPGPSNKEKLLQIYDQWYDCDRCELAACRRANNDADLVFGEGNPEADILIIGEGPGEEEDRTKIPFTGPSGNLLNQILAQVSDNDDVRKMAEWYARAPQSKENLRRFHEFVIEWRHKEFFITNAVACRPPENGTPSTLALKACWERLLNIIQVVDPLLIFAVGKIPASTLMKRPVEITKVRGNLFDMKFQGRVGEITYPVIPVLHPSFLLRKADWKTKGGDFDKTVEDWRGGLRTVDFLRNQHRGTPIPTR
jgi:uracil-DNA glycosylase family 4